MNFKCSSNDVLGAFYQSGYCLNSRFRGRSKLVSMEGETNGDRDPNTHLEQDICIHIFTVSSAMVGVRLTVIGLIRVVITIGRAGTLADDFLAADSLLFLVSFCFLTGPCGPDRRTECIVWKRLPTRYLSLR